MPTSQPHLSHPKYRPDIDGLRAVAVLSVVAFHAFPAWMKGGFIGVDVFFVISGFLISTIIFENLDRETFSFSEFYARRIKRIFPALLLVLIASYAFGWFALLADEYKQLGKHIAAGAVFVPNFVFWSESGYFDNAAATKPLLHLWSLGIEEQFYIVWPFVLWFAWKGRFKLLTITLVVAFISFALNLQGVKQDAVATFYSPQTRFWELLSGSILAWFALYRKGAYENARIKVDGWRAKASYRDDTEIDRRTLSNFLSFLGILSLAYGFLRINKNVSFPGMWAVVPVLGTALIISAGQKAWVNRTILSNKTVVWFGLISFPLYLWHWPLLSFARIVEGEVPSQNIRIGAIVLSIVLSWLTYKLVERPIRLGRNGRAKVVVLVLLMAIVGFIGYNTYKRDGLGFRHKKLDNNVSQLSYVFPSTDSCKGARPYAYSCYESERKHPDTIFLVGDSHMLALTYGFAKLFDAGVLRFNVLAIGKGGCNPFLNTESIPFEKVGYGCRNVITPAIQEALKRTDVKWVILVGRHAARFNGSGFGEVDKDEIAKPWTYRYESNGIVSKSNVDAFESGLNETVGEVIKAGKKIIFVHQFPELGFDPRVCLQRFQLYRQSKCSVDKAAVVSRISPYKDSVNRLIGNRPEFLQVDPMHFVCNNSLCSPFNESGDLMYRDDDHMSKIAAEYLAKEISESILLPH